MRTALATMKMTNNNAANTTITKPKPTACNNPKLTPELLFRNPDDAVCPETTAAETRPDCTTGALYPSKVEGRPRSLGLPG
jgi:hypothetical protein